MFLPQITECNLCGLDCKHIVNDIIYYDGAIDREEYDWCIACKHCVKGNIKRIKNGVRLNTR